MGYFVVIDGLSGCGKSTTIAAVSAALKARGRRVGTFHDRLGDEQAAVLDHAQHGINLSPLARLYFMLAVRRQVIDGAILPSLQNDDVTIVDRYYTSNIAYQAYGQGLDPSEVSALAKRAAAGAEPQRIIIIDVPAATALARMASRGEALQVFDDAEQAFHERVREGYMAQAAADTRIVLVDGQQTKDTVAEAVLQIITNDLWALPFQQSYTTESSSFYT